jgi:hypothetical protein
VLVCELRVRVESPGHPGTGSTPARLAVGAMRDGRFSSCLHVQGDEELILGSNVADGIVTLLLGTFLSV